MNYSVRYAFIRRALFISTESSFGLGTIETFIGDRVYILLGGSTPCLLREDTEPPALSIYDVELACDFLATATLTAG